MNPTSGHGPHHRTRDDGAVFYIGDRVKVIDQDIHGPIVRWDGGKAIMLDDDRDMWRFDIEPEGEEGTLTYSLWEVVKENA
tara:strand:+ start:251 stop:493 length:243 start_codon:yes stop_codon:yes gene_type:complete